jgi:3-(3-hydroxy-phenyl)propionate hydroxylase
VQDGVGGRVRLDKLAGHGWRLALSGATLPSPEDASLTVLRILRPGEAADIPADLTVTEIDGVVGAWFARHGCAAAILRPDHYVFGVASDAAGLSRLLAELHARLHLPPEPRADRLESVT